MKRRNTIFQLLYFDKTKKQNKTKTKTKNKKQKNIENINYIIFIENIYWK